MLYSLKVILEHALYSFFCFYKLSLDNYLFCPQRYLSSQYDDKDKTDSDFILRSFFYMDLFKQIKRK